MVVVVDEDVDDDDDDEEEEEEEEEGAEEDDFFSVAVISLAGRQVLEMNLVVFWSSSTAGAGDQIEEYKAADFVWTRQIFANVSDASIAPRAGI
nr:hypothetical protein BaRGS_019950 [Batillaria attramentaria]